MAFDTQEYYRANF